MWRRNVIVAGLLTATLPLAAACTHTSEALGEASSGAARAVPVEGGGGSRVILTRSAYERLGIRTETVAPGRAGGGSASTRLVVPAAAVLYDAEGHTWTYTGDGRRAYVREPVTVDHFDGDLAYLKDGPAAGTNLVVVGAPELFGIEQGVDGE